MIPLDFRKSAVLRICVIFYSGACFVPSLTVCLANPPTEKSSLPNNATNPESALTALAGEESRNAVCPSSRQILDRLTSTYQNCTSYRDSGWFESEFTVSDGSKWSTRITFRTAFQRDTLKFRFAYRKNFSDQGFQEPTILWCDGQRTMISKTEPPKFDQQKSLRRAVARLTGVSSGAAHNIPALLMSESIGGRRLTNLTELKSPQIVTIDNVTCYRLEGQYANEKIVLWIATDSYLILKIEHHTDYDGELDLYTTFYAPVLNEKIPSSQFEKQVEGEWSKISTDEKAGQESK